MIVMSQTKLQSI